MLLDTISPIATSPVFSLTNYTPEGNFEGNKVLFRHILMDGLQPVGHHFLPDRSRHHIIGHQAVEPLETLLHVL